jgi:hypothetical protein
MKVGTEEYFLNVENEVRNIKKFATKEEIANLNSTKVFPLSNINCIYGQMTGYCFNERAVELIRQCCETQSSFTRVSMTYANEMPPRYSMRRGLSYLEHYIFNYEKGIPSVVFYLKGEVSTLKLIKTN